VITPCLWFAGNPLEAAEFYMSVFPNSKIISMSTYGDTHPHLKDQPLVIDFELNGRPFQIINGGEMAFPFSEALSLSVSCKDQAEIDYYWEKLTADGGEEGPCGWLRDKYGISWQIAPQPFVDVILPVTPERKSEIMSRMSGMSKLIIADLLK
jgi:predicted 3-demethylubiquinone-9 3-methyltransferase (glyoxalase superfamily)